MIEKLIQLLIKYIPSPTCDTCETPIGHCSTCGLDRLANYLVDNDVVPVVRCEKCRYYEKAEYDDGYKMVCRLLKRQTAYCGFCYCGERREGE